MTIILLCLLRSLICKKKTDKKSSIITSTTADGDKTEKSEDEPLDKKSDNQSDTAKTASKDDLKVPLITNESTSVPKI